MILLSGADLVLPDRIISGTLVIDGERITDVLPGTRAADASLLHFDLDRHYIVPGFIDVHVHGVEGRDALEAGDAIASMAGTLPKYGVTAFCPTSIACAPGALRGMLTAVRTARTTRPPGGARVLPAHLESNFISPDYKGAQPAACLRIPVGSDGGQTRVRRGSDEGQTTWTSDDIVAEIANARPDIGIVTLAPELDGALDLITDLVGHGHRVSLGHSAATYEQGLDGIRAGARHATHLFNRMSPASHRAPGLVGAVLESDEVLAEMICDGLHVHPAMMRIALAAKRPERVMAITDGTAGSGLPPGSRASLGGRPITVRDAAYLDDGTLAGSVLTMDRAFATLVTAAGASLVDAATVCATTPARALGLQGFGVIAAGAGADLVVLDRDLRVVQTWVAGTLAYSRS
jgi:N-acetylglucosamine-6-phosphate deacetylase